MEKQLLDVIHTFSHEIQRIEALKAGTCLTLTLSLSSLSSWNKGAPPKIKLTAHFNNGGEYELVTAASLGVLMDEVFRRCQKADIEGAKLDQIENTLVALPGIDDA